MNQKGYIFIGMSGSGKTTLGKKMAQKLNYEFIDSDQLITSSQNNLSLTEVIIRHQTNENFIELERLTIEKIVLNQTVLSTGGSVCYCNQSLLKLGGEIIFLDISWSELSKRIKNFNQRGVILFQNSFKEEYYSRRNLYLKVADHIIDCDGKSIRKLLEEIKKKIGFTN